MRLPPEPCTSACRSYAAGCCYVDAAEVLGIWANRCACAWLLQGAGDVLDRPRGWSLAHLASALARPAVLAFLLAQGVPATGALHSSTAGPLGSAVKLKCLPELLDHAPRAEGWLCRRQCEDRAETSLMLSSQPLLHTSIRLCTLSLQNRGWKLCSADVWAWLEPIRCCTKDVKGLQGHREA